MTKKPALLDPGGGSPLFLEGLLCELHGSEKYNEKKDRVWKRFRHHSVSRNHKRPDSEQATELTSCPRPLQLWFLKRPQGEWGVQARDPERSRSERAAHPRV